MNFPVNSPLFRSGGKIFLIGFMGSGKTHWGSIWAKNLNMPFFDLDKQIEEAEQKTVAEIFEKKGEAYFREKEAVALRLFAQKDNCIIACGGGTPCFNDNLQWMNEKGTIIYLQSSPQDILQRVLEEQSKRPLIKNLNEGELLFFIQQKLKEREPFYTQAKIILQTNILAHDTLSTLNL
jgi:shikimate kinase